MPNPAYPSPAVPPMNSVPAYYAGPNPVQYSVPGQPATGIIFLRKCVYTPYYY
jgi:hypothetical protein